MIFYKLEASGNDFIIMFENDITNLNIKKLCDRHMGIGADGIIIMDDFYKVKIYNADGSKALMCGNGMRCLSKILSYLTSKNENVVFINHQEIKLIQIDDFTSRVSMPIPLLIDEKKAYFVLVNNSHIVMLKKNIDDIDFNNEDILLGYEKKANIHYVELIDKNNIKMKSYEYGVGKTKSCGSGSIAAFFVLHMLNKVSSVVNVIQSGGIVKCYIENNNYYLEGNVNLLCKGEILNEF